jgi:hypothetical protein
VTTSGRRLLFAVVCLLWAGFVLGVAVAEAVKFRTPTLTRLVAADVGRTVFGASQRLQLGLCLLTLGTAAMARLPRWVWGCLLLVSAFLAVQCLFIFPELEARAQAIVAGVQPAGAGLHRTYAALEMGKLLALVAAAVLALWPLGSAPRP